MCAGDVSGPALEGPVAKLFFNNVDREFTTEKTLIREASQQALVVGKFEKFAVPSNLTELTAIDDSRHVYILIAHSITSCLIVTPEK